MKKIRKELPLKRDSRYRQGYFYPKNPEKFDGTRAIYRSGLELKFFKFCDSNSNVVHWGSENVRIPYKGADGKMHTYYVDGYVMIREGDDVVKYLVEVKPHKQTKKPTKKKQKKSTFIYECVEWDKNQRKWSSAKTFAKKYGMKFLILTEKHLK